jgi:hypothetical protein
MAKKKKHAKKKKSKRAGRKSVLRKKRLSGRRRKGRAVSQPRKRRGVSRKRVRVTIFEGETPRQTEGRKEIKTFSDWLKRQDDAEEFEEVEVEGAADSPGPGEQ